MRRFRQPAARRAMCAKRAAGATWRLFPFVRRRLGSGPAGRASRSARSGLGAYLSGGLAGSNSMLRMVQPWGQMSTVSEFVALALA